MKPTSVWMGFLIIFVCCIGLGLIIFGCFYAQMMAPAMPYAERTGPFNELVPVRFPSMLVS